MKQFENELKFEDLPFAISSLCQEMAEIKELLILTKKGENEHEEKWFDLTELCRYHPDKPTKATVYSWVSAGLIPVHKGGKKLRFLKSEIDTWLKQGKKLSNQDTVLAALEFLTNKKG